MTDIATLRSDCRTWLTRSDLTDAQIATGLRLLEAELARDFRPRAIEKRVTLSATSGQVDLRTAGAGGTDLRILKIRSLTNDNDTLYSQELTELAPSQLEALSPIQTAGLAGYFALAGDTLLLNPAPTATNPGSYTLIYLERFPALDATTLTHQGIQEFYDLYLLGTLKHLTQLLQDGERTQMYAQQFSQALEGARRSETRARWSGNPQTAFGTTIPGA